MKTKWIYPIVIFLIVFLAQQNTFSQNPGDLDLYQSQANKIDEFFRIMDEKRPDSKEAFDVLFAGSPLMKSPDAAKIKESTVQKTNELWRISPQNWIPERIDAQMIGKDVVIMRYLYKSDVIPVVWTFLFYRSPTKPGSETSLSSSSLPSGVPWYCIGVKYDTNLEVFLNNNPDRTRNF